MALSISRPSEVTERRNNANCRTPSSERQFTIFIVGDTSCYLGQSVSISGLGFEPREKLSAATPVLEFQLITQEESTRFSSHSYLPAQIFGSCCNTSLASRTFFAQSHNSPEIFDMSAAHRKCVFSYFLILNYREVTAHSRCSNKNYR